MSLWNPHEWRSFVAPTQALEPPHRSCGPPLIRFASRTAERISRSVYALKSGCSCASSGSASSWTSSLLKNIRPLHAHDGMPCRIAAPRLRYAMNSQCGHSAFISRPTPLACLAAMRAPVSCGRGPGEYQSLRALSLSETASAEYQSAKRLYGLAWRRQWRQGRIVQTSTLTAAGALHPPARGSAADQLEPPSVSHRTHRSAFKAHERSTSAAFERGT